jgi:hypothetical protein
MKTEYDEVKAILKKHNALNKTLDDIVDSGSELYMDLFMYFQEDMPYGTQKARDGDPDEWIADRLCELDLVTDEDKIRDFNEDYAQRKAF